MGVLYVAFVLVCGYIYTSLHIPARYRQKRATGWDSYFEVAKHGFFAVLGAVLFTVFLDAFDLPSIVLSKFGFDLATLSSKINEYSSNSISKAELCIALIALGLSSLFGIRERSEYKDPVRRLQKLAAICKADEMESLFLQGALELEFVSITLDSRKCYIGIIFDVFVEDSQIDSIALVPFYSGYRQSEDLELKINRSYEGLYEEEGLFGENPDFSKLNYFRVVIPRREIISCSLFSPSVFDSLASNSSGRQLSFSAFEEQPAETQ
jgi:hypothetical protein